MICEHKLFFLMVEWYWDVTETTVLVVCQLLLAAGKFKELIWIILSIFDSVFGLLLVNFSSFLSLFICLLVT